MDQETKDRLDRIENMVSDNNRMLSKMRRAQKNAAFMRVVWGLIIIAACIWLYQFLKPYIAQAESAYSSINSSVTTLKSL